MKINFPSEYTVDELKARWEEFTSPARFAGSDENMDLVFTSKQNDDKVRLVRKARASKEPFSCVFEGTIRKTEKGSEISGSFRKSLFDYIIVGVFLLLLFYIRGVIMARGESLNTINMLLIFAMVCGSLLLFNGRRTKRKYVEFICRITGIEVPYFLPKSDKNDEE